MRIGEIAERTKVSRDTIRLYESMGMLIRVTRPNKYNNYKDYGEQNVDRIIFIKFLKKMGLSLKECKSVIDSIQEGTFDKAFERDFLDRKIKELNEQIIGLTELRDMLVKVSESGCDNQDILEMIRKV
ncbi:MerR family transcriptional regulator [Aureibacter tunicatorum]|uniref:DNA-binding transcriptional MerR regulator n=1 Tax=Aureibacter tunicatorum TaxID=866807 RepID=A0AAE4BSN4_9BACT|nr:MerR family transcriptional regulator [Aureibacter tunicatorum]MDR6241404.1 DNA-binding transcriptional MerR regulator [Aureibacter tunicatorum]BDD06751.1 hypothetical protein AUTU_42340 [Aureibacter tunicatorum]